MKVYINYPNPHFMIHEDPDCNLIQMHRRPEQRVLNANLNNIGDFLLQFINNQIPFRAQSGFNDVWLEINLNNCERERAIVIVVQMLIGRTYRPLAAAPIEQHC
jgi:hypothetical protein